MYTQGAEKGNWHNLVYISLYIMHSIMWKAQRSVDTIGYLTHKNVKKNGILLKMLIATLVNKHSCNTNEKK